MNLTEARTLGRKMRREGTDWRAITRQLTDQGFTRPDGKPYSVGGIHCIVNKRTKSQRDQAGRVTKNVTRTTTKVDLIKLIARTQGVRECDRLAMIELAADL